MLIYEFKTIFPREWLYKFSKNSIHKKYRDSPSSLGNFGLSIALKKKCAMLGRVYPLTLLLSIRGLKVWRGRHWPSTPLSYSGTKAMLESLYWILFFGLQRLRLERGLSHNLRAQLLMGHCGKHMHRGNAINIFVQRYMPLKLYRVKCGYFKVLWTLALFTPNR